MAICQSLDNDGSGELTYAEILNGYANNLEFKAQLDLLEIESEDIRQVFKLMDVDKDGTVSYREFVLQLYRMKTESNHMMLMFIKMYLLEVQAKLREEFTMMRESFQADMSMQQQSQRTQLEMFEYLKRENALLKSMLNANGHSAADSAPRRQQVDDVVEEWAKLPDPLPPQIPEPTAATRPASLKGSWAPLLEPVRLGKSASVTETPSSTHFKGGGMSTVTLPSGPGVCAVNVPSEKTSFSSGVTPGDRVLPPRLLSAASNAASNASYEAPRVGGEVRITGP